MPDVPSQRVVQRGVRQHMMQPTWALRACILLLSLTSPLAFAACSGASGTRPGSSSPDQVRATDQFLASDQGPATDPPAATGSCGSASAPCAVGDTGPGGGMVFYVADEPFACLDDAQCTVLEAAPAGWYGTDTDPEVPWCQADQPGYTAPVDLDPAIGAGWLNTLTINAECGPDSAAGIVLGYRGAGLDDWYLPSKDELAALYEARSSVGGMDDDPLSYYWASWQDPSLDAINAAVQFFDDEGLSGATFKDLTARVRPIRSF